MRSVLQWAVLILCLAAVPLHAAAQRYGATLPFDEYEAEDAETDGVRIGPDRRFTTVAAEASGRRAVRLTRGQSVTFVLRRAADAITLRAAIPDGPDGKGRDATLSLTADGRPLGRIALTSRYGWFYGRYPFTNRPADGDPHHYFDESRRKLGRLLPAGTRLRVSVEPGDTASWYVIDLLDAERVASPRPRPRGALSVVSFGADPAGTADASAAFERGIAAARAHHKPLWIPPGTFLVTRHLTVDRVRILGAGAWHSVVRGDGVGFYGRPAPNGSTAVELGHFAIIGEVIDRVDEAQRNAVGGAMGGGSYLHDLFIQHHKVGLWFDGPMRDISIARLRVTDLTADGLNFHRGVSCAVVQQSFWRNTGDDALAAWSDGQADHHIIFRHNTIVAPILANGIAIYGGHTITVAHNRIADTLTEGGGMHLGNRFHAVPASGRIDFVDNLVLRGGGVDSRSSTPTGAVWFYPLEAPIAAEVRLWRNRIIDPTGAAIEYRGGNVKR